MPNDSLINSRELTIFFLLQLQNLKSKIDNFMKKTLIKGLPIMKLKSI